MRGAVMGGVWLISAAYSLPLFLAYDTIHVPQTSVPAASDDEGGTSGLVGGEEFCINTSLSNAHRIYVGVNFALLYVAPLLLMCGVYARISVVLWRSGNTHSTTSSIVSGKNSHQQNSVSAAILRSAVGAGNIGVVGSQKRTGSLPGSCFVSVVPPSCEINGESKPLSSVVYCSPPNGSLTPTTGRFQRRATSSAAYGMPLSSKTCIELAALAVDCPEQRGSRHLLPSKCVNENGRLAKNTATDGSTAAILANRKRSLLTPQTGSRQIGGSVPTSPLLSSAENRGQRGSRVSLTPTSIMSNCRSGSTVGSSPMLPGQNPLVARRKVVRLLVAIVSSFAVCMLPHHVRLQWEEWSAGGQFSYEHMYIPPITTLIFYVNSCLNPLLYALISDRFRKAVRETRITDWCRHCSTAGFSGARRSFGTGRQRTALPVPVIRNELVSVSCTM